MNVEMIRNLTDKIIFRCSFCIFFLTAYPVSFVQSKTIIGNPDTTQISILLKQGDAINSIKKGSPKSALTYYQNALTLSNSQHNPTMANAALLKLSIQYARMGDIQNCRNAYTQVLNYYHARNNLAGIDKTLSFLRDELSLFKDINPIAYNERVYCLEQKRVNDYLLKDTLSAILDLKIIGDMHLNQGKLDLAEKELLKVLESYKAIHFKAIHNTYFLLGAVSHLKGDQQKELLYYTETVKGMLATNDTASACWFYFKLATIYKDLKIYDKSIIYFQKSVNSLKAIKADFGGALLQIVEVMIAEKKPKEALTYLKNQITFLTPSAPAYKYVVNQGLADCYVALGQNKEAEKYLLLMIANQLPFYQTEGQTAAMHIRDFKQIGQYYLNVKNYANAKLYLDKASALPKDNVSALTLSQLELLYFRVDSAYGNYVSSIKHFQNHKKLTDSIFNATKSKQIADLQIRYDVAQKDKNFLLLEKQSNIEKEESEQRKKLGNMLVAGVILLLVLLGLLYNRSRLRQRNIVLLETAKNEVSDKNIILQKLLQDNEWLLKEVHHRVKNNLQIVMGLLQSQTAYLKDEGALNAVLDSQHRVQAMSLIHQKLYKSVDTANIYMPEYIGELVDYLKDSFKTGLRIVFGLEIAPIVMDVIHAIPVGLILNEIITNSLKYAFPHSELDEIKIKLSNGDDNEIKLVVSDNGKGLPESFDIDHAESFGLVLIRGLIEDLSGTFLLQNKNGTTITLTFKVSAVNN